MDSETSKERQKILQRERQQRKRQRDKENIALPPKRVINDIDIDISHIPKARVYPWTSDGLSRHTLGSMNHKCQYCGANMWLDERTNRHIRSPVFSTCCAKGRVILPPLQELLPPLDILLTGNNSRSRLFHENIQMYNSALSFTSIGAKIDRQITGAGGVYNLYFSNS